MKTIPHLDDGRVCFLNMMTIFRLRWSTGDWRSMLRILVQEYPQKCLWGMETVVDCCCWLELVGFGIGCNDYHQE